MNKKYAEQMPNMDTRDYDKKIRMAEEICKSVGAYKKKRATRVSKTSSKRATRETNKKIIRPATDELEGHVLKCGSGYVKKENIKKIIPPKQDEHPQIYNYDSENDIYKSASSRRQKTIKDCSDTSEASLDDLIILDSVDDEEGLVHILKDDDVQHDMRNEIIDEAEAVLHESGIDIDGDIDVDNISDNKQLIKTLKIVMQETISKELKSLKIKTNKTAKKKDADAKQYKSLSSQLIKQGKSQTVKLNTFLKPSTTISDATKIVGDINTRTPSSRSIKFHKMRINKSNDDKKVREFVESEMQRCMDTPIKYGATYLDTKSIKSKDGFVSTSLTEEVSKETSIVNDADDEFMLNITLTPEQASKIIAMNSGLKKSIFKTSQSTRTGSLIYDGNDLIISMLFHKNGRALGMSMDPIKFEYTITIVKPEAAKVDGYKGRWTLDYDTFIDVLKKKYKTTTNLSVLVTKHDKLIIMSEGIIYSDTVDDVCLVMNQNVSNDVMMAIDIYDRYEVILGFPAVQFLAFVKDHLKSMIVNNKNTMIDISVACVSMYAPRITFVITATMHGTDDSAVITARAVPVQLSAELSTVGSALYFDGKYRFSTTIDPAYIMAMSLNIAKNNSDVAMMMSIKRSGIPFIDLYYTDPGVAEYAYRILTTQ